MREEPLVEVHRHVCDVLVIEAGAGDAVSRHRDRPRVDQEVHDRQIVRREIPDDVGVLLQQPEVDAHRVQIQQRSEIAGVDERTDAADGPIIDERVIDHEPHAAVIRELGERLRVRLRSGQRLLDEHVPAALDRRLREREVGLERRRDHDRVDLVGRDQAPGIAARPDAAVAPRGGVAAIGALVGDRDELQALGVGEIAREVRAPVAVADQADARHPRRNSATASAT